MRFAGCFALAVLRVDFAIPLQALFCGFFRPCDLLGSRRSGRSDRLLGKSAKMANGALTWRKTQIAERAEPFTR